METDTGAMVYVYNFPSSFEAKDLLGVMKSYGRIKDIEVSTTNFPENVSKVSFERPGVEYMYATVLYDSDSSASSAIKSLHGQIIYEGQVKPLIVTSTLLSGDQLMYVAPKAPVLFNKCSNNLLEQANKELLKAGEIESQFSPQTLANQYFLAISGIKNMLTEIQNYLMMLPQYLNQLSGSLPRFMNQQPQFPQKGLNGQIPPPPPPPPQLIQQGLYGQMNQFMPKMNQFNGNSLPFFNPMTNILEDNRSFHSGISSVSSSPSVSGVSTVSSNARGPPGANIFVYHLPSSVDNEELLKLFSSFGHILSTRVYKDPSTGESKGFGFVSFSTPESAKIAISQMNGYHIENKRLKVELKKE